MADRSNTLYCSFCGKSQHEVHSLIAGPLVFICNECVELCEDIIAEVSKTQEATTGTRQRSWMLYATHAEAQGLADAGVSAKALLERGGVVFSESTTVAELLTGLRAVLLERVKDKSAFKPTLAASEQ